MNNLKINNEEEILFDNALEEIRTNIYEVDQKARQQCLSHYGYNCNVCNKNLYDIYGIKGKYFIHVHHIKPLSEIKKEYIIDPIKDLRPVCPDCHFIIHNKHPCYTIEEMKDMIK